MQVQEHDQRVRVPRVLAVHEGLDEGFKAGSPLLLVSVRHEHLPRGQLGKAVVALGDKCFFEF